MIKTVVFDFGNVMIQYKPCLMADKYIDDDADRELIYEVVFDRAYWDPLDDKTITDEEIVRQCKLRLPERLHASAEKMYYNWLYNLPEMPGMFELVSHIKREYGVRTVLLSNISEYFALHADELPATHLFDRCFYSATLGTLKPEREIYDLVCRECGILPDETLFIDDKAVNIEGARMAGWHGYVFDGDVAKLRRYLDDILS